MPDPTPGPVRTTAAYGFAVAPAGGSALPWATVERWLVAARNYGSRRPVEPDHPDHGLFVLVPEVALTWTEAEFTTTPTRWTLG